MQKTITINKKRFTGKQIAKMFDEKNMTKGGDYIVIIDNLTFYGNYREIQDSYFAPICDKTNANVVTLIPFNSKFGYSYSYSIWLKL